MTRWPLRATSVRRAAAVLALMLAALQSCAAVAPRPVLPRVQIEGVRTASLVDNAVTLVVGLRVTNPNAFSVAIDTVEAQVHIEGLPTAVGRLLAPVTLVANAHTRVDVEARTTVDSLSRVVETIARRGRLGYEISGHAIIEGGRRVTYQKQGELTLSELLGRRS